MGVDNLAIYIGITRYESGASTVWCRCVDDFHKNREEKVQPHIAARSYYEGNPERTFLSSLPSFRQSLTISVKDAPFYIKASPFYIKGVRFYKNPFTPPPAVKVPAHTPLPRKTRKNSFFNRSRDNEKKAAEPTIKSVGSAL